ncbi:hypothetical protein R3W88_026554 [Solanum pinnatisectum]|uniref:Retrotransposon gag domain-containing protein n=1 Tax=Solanum pinnatisectum TaxID=50273 RepID=A0AAV9LDK7_9SOLN|nr:hypothetical protein R3W88_026554 [Solanum pinnatisectum]
MVDNNSSNERGENSEGEQLPTDLVFRLERKIAELEEEVAHMRDLAKLSISLGTHFGENADNPPLSNQTTLLNNPPINISRPEPTHPNILPPLHAQNTQIPFYHYHQQTKPTVPEPIPNANPPYNPGSNNLNPIYVETAPMTYNYHESESSQKDILIKNLTEKLDSLANRVQNVEGSKRLGGLNYEDLCMHPDVELPEGYKLPKFELFNGMGDPKAHLRMYCDKLVGIGRDERILMKLFMRSLTGEALSWYIEQDPRKWVEWVDMATDFMNRFGFNIENAPDWFYIQNLKKKPSESFREYAIRWRSEAARARPPMEESQMKDYFIRAQEPQYYDRMMLVAEKSFAEIIRLGERIEEGIKNGTIINLEALQATNKALQSGGMSENRKKTGTVMMAQGTRTPYKYQASTPPPSPYPQTPYPSAPPPTYYQNAPPQYQPISYPVYNAQPTYFQTPPPNQTPNYRNRPPYEKRPAKNYTPLAEPIAQLYERLKEAGYVTPVPALPVDVRAKWYDPNKVCAYHSGMKGHTTEVCRALKDKVQMLIDTKAIQLKDPTPNVANNPLPNHQVNMVEVDDTSDWEQSIWARDPEETITVPAKTPIIVQRRAPFEVEVARPKTPFTVCRAPHPVQYDTHAVPWNYKKEKAKVEEADTAAGVTRSGRIYTSENLVQGSSSKSKAPIVELEDQGIWKKVQAKEYSIVEQLSKTPSQISILSLLQSSETHRNALLKVLGEAYVPSSITHGEVAQMVEQVFDAYRISFHEDELPVEGTAHNKALYISVQYQDKVITKALVDSGAGLNICPLGTLTRLGVDSAKIQTWQMNVRAFDGSQRGTIGEITLDMLIGPATFPITFQVLDIPSSYNLLLGRPWIHMAGAVPSTLHQCLKFEWDHEEVVVHGEKGHPVYAIEGRGHLDGEMYHTVELVGNIEVQPWFSQKIIDMMAWFGFELEKGLGTNLQGIVEPIQPVRQSTTFGLGYKYTTEEWLDWHPPRDGYC